MLSATGPVTNHFGWGHIKIWKICIVEITLLSKNKNIHEMYQKPA